MSPKRAPSGPEEPLRLDERGRGLRDVRNGDGRGRRSFSVLPLQAGRGGAAGRGDGVSAGGDAAYASGDREPGGPEPAGGAAARRERSGHGAGEHAVRGVEPAGWALVRRPRRVRERRGRGEGRGARGGPRGGAGDRVCVAGQACREGDCLLRRGWAHGGRAVRLRGAPEECRTAQTRLQAYNKA